ncbi:MAG: hypothetical protein HY903_10585 [Deltaproteobacteria bacterium]|nr:hypothetical protein [Deltaproteobacteria bacterium]
MADDDRVESEIAALIESGGPISFYDAMGVVRSARAEGDLREPALAALIGLHDSNIATDGAREVLGEFLRVCAGRVQEERARAARTITLDDDGMTARATAGATLALTLDERAGSGHRWEVTKVQGPAYVDRLPRDPGGVAAPPVARFRVRLPRAGLVQLSFAEAPPPGTEADDDSPEPGGDAGPRTFVLRAVVDSG